MNDNYFVTDFEIVSLFMLIAIAVYVYTKYSDMTTVNRKFKNLVISVIAYSIIDIASYIMANLYVNVIWRYITFSLILFLTALTPAFLFLYLRSYIFPEKEFKRSKFVITTSLVVLFGVLCSINFRTGFIFSFEQNSVLVKGKFFPYLLFVPLFFSVQSAIYFVLNIKKFKRVQIIILSFFILASIVLPAIQTYLCPRYRIVAFAYSVFLMMLLLVIETPDEQALVSTVRELEEWQEKLKEEVDEKTHEVEKKSKKLERLTMQMIYALSEIIDAKDKYTSGHSMRVARYAKLLAQKKGLDEEECEEIFMIGILHDIGKVGLPSKIINKQSVLSEKELALVRQHPAIGSEIIEKVTMIPKLRAGVRWHHERVDGAGYPDGLKGDDIPLEAKIIAVADAYDAMTSNRSYRSCMEQAQVRQELESKSGVQFDQEIVSLMIELIDADRNYKLHEYNGMGAMNVL